MSNKTQEILALWSELFVAQPLAIKKVEGLIMGKAVLGLDEYDLLLVISRQPENKCRFALLAEKTLYTKSGVSRVAKRMIDRGFLLREGCEEDKRGSYVILTKKGIEALKQTWDHYSHAITLVFDDCFKLEEAKQLRILLGRLIDHLREEVLIPMPER